jgi:multimeric flavodoxin WrbA
MRPVMEKRFKVLMLNGSPRQNGNIAVGFREMQKIFDELNVEYECIDLGKKDVRGCIACGTCGNTGKCVFNDVVNEISDKFEKADGLVVGSPVYYGCANGTLVSALQRVFYSSHFDKRMKVGASVVCARRSGCTATFDELNKFFTISNMPVATSQYWNNIHGGADGEADQDEEGKQTMRVLARNMVFLMESIKLGKEHAGLPKEEERVWTNFTR